MEIPNWSKKDTILSLKEVLDIGRVAVAEVITDLAKWGMDKADTHFANRINGKDDE